MIKFKDILPESHTIRTNVIEEYRPAPGVFAHDGNWIDIAICCYRNSKDVVEVCYTRNNSVIGNGYEYYSPDDNIPAGIAHDLCVETEYHHDGE